MARRFKCLFSYYGSKSKVAHLYPRPQYPLIIEPFAGGASYSIRWGIKRDVLLNELNEQTYQVWDFLLTTPVDEILKMIPQTVKHGDDVSEFCPGFHHPGLLLFLRAWSRWGSFGARGAINYVTPFGEACWHRVHQTVRELVPKIQNRWKVQHGSYENLKNTEATWFIDPPYANSAGSKYQDAADAIDFKALSEWCRSRKGQVIVCENEGADWLPFRPLVKGRGRPSGKHTVKVGTEVIWTNEKTGLLW